MKLLIFGMEPCIHCRQAKAFLDAENIPYMFFDITESTARVCHFIQYIIIKFFLILQGFPCFFNTHMI